MLEAARLECARGSRMLFSGVGFSLAPGALLRVTGANGRGKTTLLRALCGLFLPNAGEVRWHGENIRALREEYWSQLLYLGHANALKDDLTPEENLAFACGIGGLAVPGSEARAALARFGLAGTERLPVRALFLLVSPTTRTHLHLLSRLSAALHDRALKRVIAEQGGRDEILSAFRRVEANFPSHRGAELPPAPTKGTR